MKFNLYLIYSIFSLLFLWSCSPANRLPVELADTYYGFLPCADCPGISYVLNLETDGDYQLSMDYYDREATFQSEGEYTYENNLLFLYNDGRITSMFEFEGDKLISLDGDGNRITTDLAPYYILYKGDSTKAEMPDALKGTVDGPIYKGTGNEPFWMVQIKENSLYFKGLMERETEFEIPIQTTTISEDGKMIEYTGEQDGNQLMVHIIHEECQDNMSGFYFPTKLHVIVTTSEMEKQELNGCGNFLGQNQLNGNWTLKEMDGNVVTTSPPTMSIYLPDAKITGSAGCNRYFSSIDAVTNSSIRFNQAGATKMACENMNIEQQYLNLFTQQDISWNINDDQVLTFTSPNGTFVFERSN